MTYGSNFHVHNAKTHPPKLLNVQFLLSDDFMHEGSSFLHHWLDLLTSHPYSLNKPSFFKDCTL